MNKLFIVRLTADLYNVHTEADGRDVFVKQLTTVLKHFRYATGLGLKEAKDIVDALYRDASTLSVSFSFECIFTEEQVARLLAYPYTGETGEPRECRIYLDSCDPYHAQPTYYYIAS